MSKITIKSPPSRDNAFPIADRHNCEYGHAVFNIVRKIHKSELREHDKLVVRNLFHCCTRAIRTAVSTEFPNF